MHLIAMALFPANRIVKCDYASHYSQYTRGDERICKCPERDLQNDNVSEYLCDLIRHDQERKKVAYAELLSLLHTGEANGVDRQSQLRGNSD